MRKKGENSNQKLRLEKFSLCEYRHPKRETEEHCMSIRHPDGCPAVFEELWDHRLRLTERAGDPEGPCGSHLCSSAKISGKLSSSPRLRGALTPPPPSPPPLPQSRPFQRARWYSPATQPSNRSPETVAAPLRSILPQGPEPLKWAASLRPEQASEKLTLPPQTAQSAPLRHCGLHS